ncbi:MAG: type II toxin-antitoxin system VapC family toxin [Elusimicrobia bacterium]|nr:type II toxin-antitoxin system VapC family toxin [Elusimicrobiota bacterium]
MKYLLDTSVISELVRPKPEAGVVRWLDERDEESLFLSVLTLGELHKGVVRLPTGPRKNKLQYWIDEDLSRRFYGKILDITVEVAAEWGHLQAHGLNRGEPIPVVDSLIAATAIVNHLTVATRNTKDLERCGAPVYNPWPA